MAAVYEWCGAIMAEFHMHIAKLHAGYPSIGWTSFPDWAKGNGASPGGKRLRAEGRTAQTKAIPIDCPSC